MVRISQFTAGRRGVVGVIAGIAIGGVVGGAGLALAAPSSPAAHKASYHLGRVVVNKGVVVQSGAVKSVNVRCPKGKTAIGGGGHYGSENTFNDIGNPLVTVIESDINLAGNGWRTAFRVTSPQSASAFTATAICVNPH